VSRHPAHEHEHEHPDEHRGHHDDRAGGWRGRLHGLTHVVTPHSHDSRDATDEALEASHEGVRAVKMSLLALLVTAALQLAVVAVSGSVALLADTIHNFSDALTALPLWVAFVLARRAPTRRFPYGYGRAEDLAGVFIVAMIALSAVVAGVESVRRLLDPVELTNVGWVFAAGLVGFAGNELVAVYRIRVGRRIGSAALVADGLHARTDGFTSLAVVAGAAGVALGFPLADPVVGLVITVAILVVLKGAATEVWRRLMDGVDPDLVTAAERALAAQPHVVAVERVRMRWIGHQLIADADVRVPDHLSVGRGHEIAHAARDAMVAGVPRLRDATVHVGPASTAAGPAREAAPGST
jgi:cation diffusion facilitator family transporter